jgi:class 3 adenylate cyclase
MPTLDHYQRTAATLLKQGAPLVAYDTVAEGLRQFPGDPRLRQLLALSLARTGASRRANELLRALVNEGHSDEETVGMLARTYKDLWAQTAEPEARRRHLESAFRWYREAHRKSGGYWSGINAATMALLLDDHDQSMALARKVLVQCLDIRIQQPEADDAYWVLATLGEAALLLRDLPAAEGWYREAIALGIHGVSDLVSTRRNARLILRHEQADATAIDACFRIPRVAVFAGHLIDHPDRAVPRFPPELEEDVRRELLERLRRYDVGFGYSSAANGGDILFLEGLTEIGAERHIVLPYNREQFLEDSVDFIPGTNWAARYRTVLERATEVVTASEQRMLGGAMSYEYGFLLLDGTAAVRAEELETELLCFALWDGELGDGPGGTATSIEHWRRANREVDIVHLPAPGQQPPPITVTLLADEHRPVAGAASRASFEAQLVGLLFADVAGFSKLTEDEIPRFVEYYLGRVAALLADSVEQPLLCNTWGDGLYLVFRSVRETGAFALRLSEALRDTDWTTYGLPSTLSLRVAVHAGPAYACIDPVTGRQNYLGAHVALAARIEPVTPPGEVYGSGAFAALAKANQVSEFLCAYVGQTPLAKAFGTFPMYVLRPRI